jgi:hypothetical protein
MVDILPVFQNTYYYARYHKIAEVDGTADLKMAAHSPTLPIASIGSGRDSSLPHSSLFPQSQWEIERIIFLAISLAPLISLFPQKSRTIHIHCQQLLTFGCGPSSVDAINFYGAIKAKNRSTFKIQLS